VLYAEGKLEEEARVCERRVEMLRASYPGDHAWVASALSDLGAMRVRDGRHDQGEALIREALGMFERLDSPGIVHAWRELAVALESHGDLDAAAESFRRTLELCSARGLDNHALCLVARANHASLLARYGSAEQALREADAAGRALAASIGTAGHEYAAALSARAEALQRLGRKEEAEAARREAYIILEDHFGPGHPEVEAAKGKLEASSRGG
jgi:tetratricopeptide (TPR) repeat protein